MKFLLNFKEILIFIAIVLSLTTYVSYNEMLQRAADEQSINNEIVSNIE